MKIFYQDNFPNIEERGYKPVGRPVFFINNIIITDRLGNMDDLERKILLNRIKEKGLNTISQQEFEEMIKKEIINENGPYMKFDGVAMYNKNHRDLNSAFKVKGDDNAGLDYIIAVPLRNGINSHPQ